MKIELLRTDGVMENNFGPNATIGISDGEHFIVVENDTHIMYFPTCNVMYASSSKEVKSNA